MNAELPVRVVVFASEQLFPALQFLLHAADRFDAALASIHIFHTDDARRSAEPAQRLKDVMQRWGGRQGLDFEIQLTKGGMWPAGVRAVMLDCLEASPSSRWLVNVTGGTKPMSAAATELALAAGLESRRVLYQEIDGRWVELVTGEDGLLDAVPLQPGVDEAVPPADTLERLLPVEELVAAQFSAEHRISTQSLNAFPVDEAVRELIARRWSWAASLDALDPPVRCSGNGDAFERFVGSGLLDSGLRFAHSLKVWDRGPGGKVVREVDLVGCHRGRLVCIDIKLPGAADEQKGTQLADVAELAHSLGGRGALPVALRPGWPQDEGTERLARALGVCLLTQAQAGRLFSAILERIDSGMRPGEAARRAEELLLAHQGQGNTVLSSGRVMEAGMRPERDFLKLTREMERISEQRGEPWVLVELIETEFLIGVRRKALRVTDEKALHKLEAQLHRRLDALSDGRYQFRFQSFPAWIHIQFFPRPGVKVGAITACLRELLG
ncbi:hypothetical protein [Caldimonas tepidiphila]|uniref:hypothetical protein n=1 Tax=Caldimonas tepidiphila TaxID=2315841 RepID=UPI001474C8D3|nr:hypothetical protein [Caldimonas tepidiphila]